MHAVRAFSDPRYNYYRLTRDFGILKKGTIFYHDPDDGCLKNCWSPEGNCQSGYCGGVVALHTDYIDTDWFEKVERNVANLAEKMSEGTYLLKVCKDGTWFIMKGEIITKGEN